MKLIVEILFIAIIVCLAIVLVYRPKLTIEYGKRIIVKCRSLINLLQTDSRRNKHSDVHGVGVEGDINGDNVSVTPQDCQQLDSFQSKLNLLQESIGILCSRVSKLQKSVETLNQYLVTQNEFLQESVEKLKLNQIETSGRKLENLGIKRQFEQKILYASIVDSLDPVGFINENLREVNSNCCFMIEIQSSHSAMFSIVDNADVHMGIIANLNAFTNICSMQNENYNATHIEILKPGRLILDGNIWVVKEKMSIKIL